MLAEPRDRLVADSEVHVPPTGRTPSLALQIVFLIGPAIFLLVGFGFLTAAGVAPPEATTDDGYPLPTFFLLMGAVFGGMGLVWLVGAILGIRHGKRKDAETEARRDHLHRHGARLLARVVSCESEGYMNFKNEVWTDLVLDYDVPGIGRRRVSRTIALARPMLEHARAGGALPILVDPRAPDDYLFPRSGQ